MIDELRHRGILGGALRIWRQTSQIAQLQAEIEPVHHDLVYDLAIELQRTVQDLMALHYGAQRSLQRWDIQISPNV
jgi:hypothetical protein